MKGIHTKTVHYQWHLMSSKGFILCFAMFFINFGCLSKIQSVQNERNSSEQITKDIRSGIDAFHTADTSKNALAVINLLWPDFTMLVDGKRIAYEDAKNGSLSFMATLKTFHTEWSDIQIQLLADHIALSSFIFKDSIVAKSGELIKSQGPTTFIWEKRDGLWKVLYADSDHYPVD
jgi:ketosteroid isomerase-like protein